MKRVLTLTFLLLLNFGFCFCQSIHELRKDTSECKNSPIILLKNADESYISSPEVFHFIDPNNIDSISVNKKDYLIKQYGPNAKNGVIEITLKKHIDLINIAELFAWHKMEEQYRGLPVYLDSSVVCRPDNVYFVLKKIKYVKIENEKKPV